MSELVRVLLLAGVPAAGSLAAGLLAERIRVSSGALSFVLHFVAGLLIGVVGVELMPRVLEAQADLLMVLLLLAGGVFMTLVDWGTSFVSSLGGGGAGGGALVVFLGVSADIFTDGLMISSGAAVSSGLSLLLAIALLAVDAPEAFSTVVLLKRRKAPRRTRQLIIYAFPVMLMAGALGGFLVLRERAEVVHLGVLAFTAGIVVNLVVSQIVRQAHEQWTGRVATLMVIFGFALVALLSTIVG